MNIFKNITHIIFDLDGLLVDSEPLWQESEEWVLGQHGKAWDTEIARRHIGLRMDEAAALMCQAYQLELAPAALENEVIACMFRAIPERLIVMPGADELVRQAYQAGLILGIASSSREDYIRAIVQQMGWDSMISTIASAYDVARGKPAPDVYLKSLVQLGAEAQQTIAFEDSVNGSRAAKAAGLRCIAIPGHGFHPQDFDGIADATYRSLEEVIPLLAR